MSFDPYAPYGPVVTSTIRVVTWNVWGHYGTDREARQAALEEALVATAPNLVCLVEAWRQGDQTQAGRVAARLGLPYHRFAGDWPQEDWVSGFGFVSRWPMTFRRGRAAGVSAIRPAARCSASAGQVSSRFPTTTGWRPTFVTEPAALSRPTSVGVPWT